MRIKVEQVQVTEYDPKGKWQCSLEFANGQTWATAKPLDTRAQCMKAAEKAADSIGVEIYG